MLCSFFHEKFCNKEVLMQGVCMSVGFNAELCTLHETFKSLPVLIAWRKHLRVFLSKWFIRLSLFKSTLCISVFERKLWKNEKSGVRGNSRLTEIETNKCMAYIMNHTKKVTVFLFSYIYYLFLIYIYIHTLYTKNLGFNHKLHYIN